MSARTIPALSNIGRAYLTGRVAMLRPPSPLQQHRVGQALAGASPEIAAAYAAGAAADPRLPLPPAEAVLAHVVARLARQSVEELRDPGTCQATAGDTSGPECASAAQLGHLGPAL